MNPKTSKKEVFSHLPQNEFLKVSLKKTQKSSRTQSKVQTLFINILRFHGKIQKIKKQNVKTWLSTVNVSSLGSS